MYYDVRPAKEVRPNQIKCRFHDHNREGVGVVIGGEEEEHEQDWNGT